MFYVFHGDEEFTRSEEVKKLKAQVANDGLGDLNTSALDGRHVDLDELFRVCGTLPFLSDRRLVLVDNLLQRFEPKGKAEPAAPAVPTAGEQENATRLVAFLPTMPSSTRLVFVESIVLSASNPVLRLSQDKRSGGYVREFRAPATGELGAWVTRRAREKGQAITRDAASLLAHYVGRDLRLLDQELDKLSAHANYARPIAGTDVRELVTAAHDDNVFVFVDQLGARNREGAMRQLRELLAHGDNELYLLAMVARQLRLILAAKDLRQRGAKPEDIQRTLRISRGFVLDKVLTQGRLFTLEELESMQRRILEIDQSIKTGRVRGSLALELLVAEIIPPAGPKVRTPMPRRNLA